MSTATLSAPSSTTSPAAPTASLQARVNDLLSYIRAGRILDAMREFYAADVRMQENNNPPTVGLSANYEREEKFVAYVKQWKQFEVDAVAIDAGRGKVLVQSRAEFDAVDGKTVKLDQVAVQTWRDGRIVEEKFYYDTGAAK
jgi:ketosteroid isomerase-like protein